MNEVASRNFNLATVRQALVILCQMATILFIVKSLGPNGLAEYTIALIGPNLFVLLLNLGMPSSSVYLINSRGLSFSSIFCVNAFMALALVPVGLAVANLIYDRFGIWIFGTDTISPQLIALYSFPGLYIQSLSLGLLQAREKFSYINLLLILQALAILAAIFFTIVCFSNTIEFALYIINGVNTLVGIASVYLVLRDETLKLNNLRLIKTLTHGVRYGIVAHTSNVITFLVYRVDILMINKIAGPEAAGIYSIAIQIVERVWIVSNSLALIWFPIFSKIRKRAREKIVANICSASVSITALLYIFVMFISAPILLILFTNIISALLAVMVILSPGIVLWAGARIICSGYAASGKPVVNLIASTVALVTNFAMNLVLIPAYGIYGGALASALSYSITFALLYIHHRQISNVALSRYMVIDGRIIVSFMSRFRK